MSSIADEPPCNVGEAPADLRRLEAANDNGVTRATNIDPRVLAVARAIGRQIAREAITNIAAANDDRSPHAPEKPK